MLLQNLVTLCCMLECNVHKKQILYKLGDYISLFLNLTSPCIIYIFCARKEGTPID